MKRESATKIVHVYGNPVRECRNKKQSGTVAYKGKEDE
jgi:hypothetical protein